MNRDFDHWEFLEASFSKEQLIESYDYALCQRPDGSYYGIAEGLKCRKGTETSRKSIMDANDNFSLKGKKLDVASAKLRELDDEQFARVTQAASETISVKPSPKVGTFTSEDHRLLIKNEQLLLSTEDSAAPLLETFRKISDKEAEAFVEIMDSGRRTKLGAGVISRVQNNTGDSTKEIKTQLSKRWLEQDGKCAYTGKKINLCEAELEHVVSYAKYGTKIADRTSNLVFVDRNVNQGKADLSMKDFYEKRVKSVTAKEQQALYEISKAKKSAKGNLKQSAISDAKELKGRAEEIIKQYGKGVYYITSELGFQKTYGSTKDGRSRGYPMYGSVKTSKSRKKEQVGNVIIRGWASWTPSQQKNALKIWASYASAMKKNDSNRVLTLQKVSDALEKL